MNEVGKEKPTTFACFSYMENIVIILTIQIFFIFSTCFHNVLEVSLLFYFFDLNI